MTFSTFSKNLAATVLLASIGLGIQAQTIFTYGKYAVDKSEFVNMYESNNSKSAKLYTEQDLNEYLDLYAVFKMKVAEARAMHLDTAAALRADVDQYRRQTAKGYLVDQTLSETLLKEAYERSKWEISIAHIQISARGTDTASAWSKINEIYNQIQDGKITFEEAAAKYSEDRASKDQGGAVGYISALDVLYPIETAAYNTEVGQIASPVRTTFGYHIVKVLDKRPSRGRVQVAQILIEANRNNQAAVDVARSKANNIYQKLKQGANFEEMVKANSDDRFTVNNGGLMEPFSSGKLDPNFEEAAFALKNPGDISEPVQTDFGFHIIKLVKKMGVPDFESARDELSARLKKDGRVALAEEAMKNKWLQDVKFQENEAALQSILAEIRKDTARKSEIKDINLGDLSDKLITINGKVYTQKDYIDFLVDATGGVLYGRKDRSAEEIYRMFKNKVIEDEQVAYLYAHNPQYKAQVDNYEESTLVFALMEKRVWEQAMNDRAGQQAYYEANKSKYIFDAGFAGNIFESGSKASLTLLRNKLLEGKDHYEAIEEVNEIVSEKVGMQSGKYEYKQLPAKVSEFEQGKLTEIYQAENGNYFFVMPLETFPSGTQKTFEEASWVLVSDYQAHLEKEWLKQLRGKYPISVKKSELKKLIKNKK